MLFHHMDIDTVEQRQFFSCQRCSDCAALRLGAWCGIEDGGAECRIGAQHDAVTALPLLDHERAGADRMIAGVIGMRIDHFARQRCRCRHGHLV